MQDETPLADGVNRQYERWRYPAPIQDLDGWLQHNWEWFDPSHAQRQLWPDRPYQPDLDILIAGCGTNQAAVFARTNPQARVFAIDVSEASLDHQRHLRDRYGLHNLELQRLPIEDLPALGRDFDLIVSTGVLHHLHDPAAGLRALAACARPDAVIGLMLYAAIGRFGVGLLQSVFHDLGLAQDDASLAVVRETLALLPARHPARSYLGVAHDLNSDAGLVDTFLHARERDYTVADCLELVRAGGLVFQGWLQHAPYHLHPLTGAPESLVAAVGALPPPQRWSVLERMYAVNACHFFMACRPERPRASYTIDFTGDTWLDYVPQWRTRCGRDGNTLFRPDWRMTVDTTQASWAQHIDGVRSIRAIMADAAPLTSADIGGDADRKAFAKRLFEGLWQLDFLAFALPTG